LGHWFFWIPRINLFFVCSSHSAKVLGDVYMVTLSIETKKKQRNTYAILVTVITIEAKKKLTGCCNGPGYLEVSEFIQWYQLASH
jgi:hypothetical protein